MTGEGTGGQVRRQVDEAGGGTSGQTKGERWGDW